MKIFLTGATGYIGGAVAQALLAANHSVTGMARSAEAEEKLRGRGITPYRADFREPESLTDAVQSCEGVISTGTTNDGALDQRALAHMLRVLKGTGRPFVYTSGIRVLGDTGGHVADEATPVNPIPLVSWRTDAEKMVLEAAADGIRAIVIRPAIVYGHNGGIPTMLIQSAQQSGAARYVGAGNNRWPTVHLEDLADLFVRVLEKAPAAALYHAAAEPAYRVQQIAEAASLGAGAGGRIESWPLDQARQTLGPFADALALDQQLSSQKARRELGWTPRRPSLLDDLRSGSYALRKAAS